MTAADMHVGAVIVTYNCSALAIHAVEVLVSDRVPVVVWDNASSASERAVLRDQVGSIEGVLLVESERNLGFGAGVNRAATELACWRRDVEYLWIVNPDLLPTPGAAARLAESATRIGVELISPKILQPGPGGDLVWFAGGELHPRAGRSRHVGIGRPASQYASGVHKSTFLTGAALMVRMSTWKALGGFDESLFLYCEDAELSMRAAAAGCRMATDREIVVTHLEGGSSKGRGRGPTFYYYVHRNRLIVYRREASVLGLLGGSGFPETVRLLLGILLRRSGYGRESLIASLIGVAHGLKGVQGPNLAGGSAA